MPITPLHYPLAWGLSKTSRKLSLPALVVGSVIPDIECVVLWLFFRGVLPDHLVLHSLIGGLTLGTFIAVVVTVTLYTPIISGIFKVDKGKLKEVCKFTPTLVASCFLGVVSHLLIDYTHHWYNPILWPWIDPYVFVGPLAAFFAFDGNLIETGYPIAQLLVHSIMIVFWLAILSKYRNRDLWDNIWIGNSNNPDIVN